MAERKPGAYRVYRKMSLVDFLNPDNRGDFKGDFVLIELGTQIASNRKEAIRAVAREHDTDGVPYAAVSEAELTEHAPLKKINYE